MPGLQDPCLLPCFLWDHVDHQHQQCPAEINSERLEASNQHEIHKIINLKVQSLTGCPGGPGGPRGPSRPRGP